MNPFEDRIVPIGHCRDIATCGQLEETSFFSFANTPAIPPAETARGSVLLVAGRRGNGKTVYGHRLLHEYHARNLRPVDLLRIGHVVKGSPARRHQVLIDLRKAVDPLDSTDLQVDDDIWGDRLCDILNRAGGGLAVRLPGVQQNGATHTDIAWEICQYAMAAQLNDSVLIYEYLTDTWPDDWHKLFAHVEQNHDVTVRDRVLDNLSADDLWTYVEGVMERSPNRRIALAPGVPEELRQTFSRRSLSLSGMHGFMRAAFAAAIAENSPEVSHRHLLTAALDGQGGGGVNTATAPLVDNPFPLRPPDLGAHHDACEGPENRDGYVAFADRPGPPDAEGGGVVLIAGRPHLGKSVLAHRCLHRYEAAGHLVVDLADRPSGELAGPADLLARMGGANPLPGELRSALREVRTGEPVEGHHDLGRALGGRRLAVRLPRPDPNLRPAAIVTQVLAYARAAVAANAGVYLFEYPYWVESDWTQVREGIARSPDGGRVTAVGLDPFSDRDLLRFLRARMGGQEGVDALLDLDPEMLLRALARQRASLSPNNLTWFNVLCHQAFAAAIEAGATRIAIHHYLAAAVRIGAP